VRYLHLLLTSKCEYVTTTTTNNNKPMPLTHHSPSHK